MSVSTKIPIPIFRRAGALNMGALQTPLIFLGLSTFYMVTAGSTPVRVDEYYTLFAARSWADNGTFAILDGEYTRARLFTILIGATYDLLGHASILIARLPTALAAGALVTLLFSWVRQRVDITAATAAAITLALSGYTLDVAHFARFYAPQALTVLGAAMLVFAAAGKEGAASLIRLAAAAALLALGFHLQPTTIIAAAAIALWFVLERFEAIREYLQHRRLLALSALGLACMAAAVIAPALLERYATASVWAQEHQYDRLFYVQEFARQIPALLILFPVAAVVALRRDRRLALLALIIIVTTVVAHSFAAMKAGRYVYYCLPFVAVIFGLATSSFAEKVISATNVARIALIAGGLAILLVNPSYRHTIKTAHQSLITLEDSRSISAPADPIWDQAAPALRQLIGPNDFLIASDDLRTIAFLRPHDMLINASHLSDLGATQDFTRDVRTGRPILGSVAGLDRVIDCRDDGLIVVDDAHWRTPKGVPAAVADRIEQRALPVRPRVENFQLFRWHHRASATCPWVRPEGLAA
ncbi:MAG: ArnT family glycosyltransferase [Sphingobium sp.]